MVKSAWRNGKRFLLSTQNTILSAALIIAVTYGISAILSFVRSRLLANYFGAGEELAVFYTADKIPSFVYSLIVVGTISTVFIPVFTDLLQKNKSRAWETASSMINLSVLAFGFLGLVAFIFADKIIWGLSVGRFTAEQVILGANLMRIMIGAQLLLVISSFITSLLQSFKYFVLPSLAPVMYNVGMILGIVLLTPKYGIYGPAIGVSIGAVLHFVVQLPLLFKLKFPYKFALNFGDKGVREILSLVPSRILGSSLIQISSIINNSLAIMVATSAAVVFKFADQLQSFPVTLFGASIALAALPTLSEKSGNTGKFKKTFLASFHQMMFLVIPSSVILLVLRVPIVRIVFGAKGFPWDATLDTALTLGFFSVSIFAQSGMYMLTRAFYALKDTATPVKVSLATILLSTSLGYTFVAVYDLGVWSIALAYSIAAILDVVLLLWLLGRKIGGFDFRSIFMPFGKISVSALLMGVFLYVPVKMLDFSVFDTSKTLQLLGLVGVAGVAGMASYIFFTWVFKVEEIELFYKIVRKFSYDSTVSVAKEESVDTSFTDAEAIEV